MRAGSYNVAGACRDRWVGNGRRIRPIRIRKTMRGSNGFARACRYGLIANYTGMHPPTPFQPPPGRGGLRPPSPTRPNHRPRIPPVPSTQHRARGRTVSRGRAVMGGRVIGQCNHPFHPRITMRAGSYNVAGACRDRWVGGKGGRRPPLPGVAIWVHLDVFSNVVDGAGVPYDAIVVIALPFEQSAPRDFVPDSPCDGGFVPRDNGAQGSGWQGLCILLPGRTDRPASVDYKEGMHVIRHDHVCIQSDSRTQGGCAYPFLPGNPSCLIQSYTIAQLQAEGIPGCIRLDRDEIHSSGRVVVPRTTHLFPSSESH